MATRFFASILTDLTAQPASAEVYYNRMQRLFEALCLRAIVSATTTAEPVSPTNEDIYVMVVTPTGTNWAGHGSQLAIYLNTTWYFFTPAATWEGLGFYVQDTNYQIYWDGSAWSYVAPSSAEVLTPSVTHTQAGATLLTKKVTFAITGSADDSYRLPPAVLGLEYTVSNNLAQQLRVYPASGDAIDAIAVDTHFTVPAGPAKSTTFRARDTTTWQSATSA